MADILGYKTLSKVPVGFYFCIFIFFINSMEWWPGWEGRTKWINIATVIMLFISLYNYYYVKFVFDTKKISLVLILTLCFYYFTREISAFAYMIVYLVIVCLRNDYQSMCLQYIYKWFAWLMVPCIIVYFFAQVGIMPSFGTLHTIDDVINTYFSSEYTTRSNYLFYCYSPFYGIRFNGPFIEPGHLGMITAFLLFADGFNFKKKETWILLFTTLLTMSLSGIMLALLGFFLIKYEQKKIKIAFIIIFGVGILLIYLFGTFYRGGDNIVNEYVLSRLEYDEERGFSGNNRVFGQIDLYYAAMFNDTHTMMFGYDKETIEYLAWNNSRGTGYVMCMVSHGIVGTIAGVLFYIIYSIWYYHKRTTIVFLIFVLMMFWQRTYPFWFSWLICFVFGLSNRKKTIYENRNSNIPPQSQLRSIVTGNCITQSNI